MKKRILSKKQIVEFKKNLIREERSTATVGKYERDIEAFMQYANGADITKEFVISYKNKLIKDGYAVKSVNSMISAVNSLFNFLCWQDLKVKAIKQQQKIYCTEEKELTKEEYVKLVKTAESNGNRRLSLMLQTICATGIRVSELRYVTYDAAKRGEATVSLKGKTRVVMIVKPLQIKLLQYAKEQGITSGPLFLSVNGNPLGRSHVWREMKSICEEANVNPEKVYPHNLRHLFARSFYDVEKDIAKLADVLGHSSINTTRIYIVSTGAEHRLNMEKMNLIL